MYPIKRHIEDAKLLLTTDPEEKKEVIKENALERIEELDKTFEVSTQEDQEFAAVESQKAIEEFIEVTESTRNIEDVKQIEEEEKRRSEEI